MYFRDVFQIKAVLIQTYTPSVTTVCRRLSAGGACSQIPQHNHGSNTNKVVGGEGLCACVCAQVKGVVFALLCSQLLPLQVLQPSLTHCVSDCLYKAISDRFNLYRLFYCVCHCIRMQERVFASLVCLQRLLFCGFSADHPLKPSSLSSSWNRNHWK